MKRGAEDSLYDFKSMLDEFNSTRDRPPLLINKRRKSRMWSIRRPRRSPFKYERSPDLMNCGHTQGTPPSSAGSSILSTPPQSPQFHLAPDTSNKRRKTKAWTSDIIEDFYCGDQYEIDFRRRDLCLQMQLLRTSENKNEFEDALIWSSSEEEDD